LKKYRFTFEKVVQSVSQLHFLLLNIIFYSGALKMIVFSEFRFLCNSSLGYSATQTYQTNIY